MLTALLRIFRRNLIPLFAVFSLLLVSCVTAPVQEMSDARQAIEAAEAAEADRYAPRTMEQARSRLRSAEESLDSKSFKEAQRDAELARQAAIEAREQAIEAKLKQP